MNILIYNYIYILGDSPLREGIPTSPGRHPRQRACSMCSRISTGQCFLKWGRWKSQSSLVLDSQGPQLQVGWGTWLGFGLLLDRFVGNLLTFSSTDWAMSLCPHRMVLITRLLIRVFIRQVSWPWGWRWWWWWWWWWWSWWWWYI